MSKKTKVLLRSMLAVCLCTILVVGATYALFSDTAVVNNHLKAGNLDVGLWRVSYWGNMLTEDGLLAPTERDNERIDLTKDPRMLFDVEGVVPQSWYEADIEVVNNGSTAFDYYVTILWDAEEASKEQIKFAEQIEISISSESLETPVVFRLIDCAKPENTVKLGYILANTADKASTAQKFTVRATLTDDVENNAVMEQDLEFDLQVYASQKVS